MDQPRLELDFHQVFERVTDAYVALDRDWRYTYLNAAAGELFGRRAEQLIGRHIWTEFPEGVGQPFQLAYEKAMVEQCPQQVEAFYPPYHRWFESRVYPSADGLTIYFRDITERKRAEQLATGQHEILEGIAAQRPLVESLERIARLHETMNPGALCSLLLLDDDGRHVLHGAAPSLPDAYNRAMHGQEIGEAHGSCGTAAWHGERVVVADIASHPYWENYREVALAHDLKACWSTPVLGSHNEVLGTFAVYFREPREPREEELRSIDQMLPITGIAIESEHLVARLRERNRFFELSQEIFCILDPRSGRLLQFNPSLPRLTGYGASELTSRPYREFLLPQNPGDDSDPMLACDQSGECVREFVNRCRCRDGSERLLEWVSFAAPDGLLYAVARDITERRRVEAELARASSHDPVTGLPQHLQLRREASDLLKDTTAPVWVLVIGLDRFQGVNESVGHLSGDDVLRQLAGRLQAALAGQGRVARFAGDEFVVTATGLSADGALALAERLRAAVAEPVEGSDYRLLLTASVGISHSPDHGTDPNDLLRRAEAAMSQAKREGRDRVSEFSVEQMRDLEDRLVMGNQLRDAIRRGELELHYQPQYRATDRRLTGFEALLRWNSGQLGQVPPGRFIPIAEALGLMPEIGEWVLDAACRQLRAWLDHGHRDFTVAVNMSAQQLQRPGLAAQVGAALQQHGVPAAMLDIEITESSFMENVWRVQRTLAELKALGLQLSLDDFGTGYSSLAYLKQFPIDKLKIDQSFVRELPADAADAAIVRTIIAVAHELHMHVAAEGVATQAQADFLAAAGCDELQGNHLGPALNVEQAGERFGVGRA
ncbi:diguanylate cyclase [Rhodanobacter thiooxydans]|uniref:cyclic-guanylate-specific phosphodiesterase n=1 Tax=Rhodanobacter thiooxydans TaxID=416169 RepID=A0A154QKI6_9GAMM|nr:EAL domain-containing protein [Rhodanobacter thiooxydans]EIM02142.1 diguanylate cyclase/phosphodiesterase [Rhodanobacter thiooxydans LCS2]KZC24267.1 diguanylate cyclase [Rhodanobacter thiooxydans]MCW0203515.1 EAL domain-containing protein [Rhodanobacter thiooxydans]